MRKKTTEEFILEAKGIYKNKYDYSLTEYTGNKNKVKIICPDHGVFEKTPNKHLSGEGCISCSRISKGKKKALPYEEFIKRAKKIHGDTFKYKKESYVNSTTKMTIVCPVHGDFTQHPQVHLRGSGCTYCRASKISKSKTKDTSYFISKSKSVHGDKYKYDKADYKGSSSPIIVTCKEHGDFKIARSIDHYSVKRVGCPECSLEEFKINISNTANSRRKWGFKQPEEYKLIPVTQGKFAKVDNEDFDKLKGINWLYSHGYAKNKGKGMQNFIINPPKGKIVDHINRDKLDNRRSNLRLATHQQNAFNQTKRKGTSSKYKGVYWDKSRGKWASEVKKDYRKYHVGRFDCEVEAGKAYDKKAKELFGKFANLNFK